MINDYKDLYDSSTKRSSKMASLIGYLQARLTGITHISQDERVTKYAQETLEEVDKRWAELMERAPEPTSVV